MKRSEAIDIIINLIEANLDTLKDIPDASLVSELILYSLESKGMSPPDDEGIVFGWNEGFIKPPEWESEDGN